jgi:malonate transporter MadM subunit
MDLLTDVFSKYDLVFAFLFVGLLMSASILLSRILFRGRIPGAAIAITLGLVMAWFGGRKGVADFPVMAGLSLLGGAMLRDFSIVSTAMGASLSEIRKSGPAGITSLFLGIITAFGIGSAIAVAMGHADPRSIATIGAGACTFIVGPVTGAALGAPSDIIALSIAIGVIKTVVVTILTPLVADRIGLDNPHTAMVYGGLIGTTSGVAAGLAATDARLVPYGALTATFYTGTACLLCPSLLYYLLTVVLPR